MDHRISSSPRRRVLRHAAALVATLATGLMTLGAHAQDAWPTKPVKLISPFPPGGTSDVLARVVADMAWAGGAVPKKMPVGRLYGLLLLGFTLVACFGAFLGDAKLLLMILGATAAPITAFSALQILRLNTTLLPRELRPPLWRKIALILCALFYGFISFAMFRQIFSH